MEYYFAGQVEDYIVGIAKNYFDDISFKVKISSIPIDPAIDLTTTFEEYFFRERYFVFGSMEINETTEENMREFAAELMRRNIHFSIGINIPSINEGYSVDYFREDINYDFYRRK